MSVDKEAPSGDDQSDHPEDRVINVSASIEPVDNPDDLLGEALCRMNRVQREVISLKAVGEAIRLNVKQREGEVDRDVEALKVEAASEAAIRLRGTGADFEMMSDHQSQHGSIYVSVRSKPPSIAGRIGGLTFHSIPLGVVRAVLTVVAVSGLVVIGVLVMGGRVEPTAHDASELRRALATSTTKAIGFVDGDTFTVASLDGNEAEDKIRLLAIDTPERGQPYFTEASSAMAAMVGSNTIKLEHELPGKLERDKYGRVLAYVIVDGLNVNVELVRQGWTAYVAKYGRSRFESDFVAAEDEARAAHRGIWSSR